MIVFLLIWLLLFDACQLRSPAPPYDPPHPIIYEENTVPELRPIEKPQVAAPKNMSEHDHLKLLEGQLGWMQKRIKNEKAEWNDR